MSETAQPVSFPNDPDIRALLGLRGWPRLTETQAALLPAVLGDRDLIGVAPTGTGKTAVIALAARRALTRAGTVGLPRVLVVAPTRALCAQLAHELTASLFDTPFRVLLAAHRPPLAGQIEALDFGVDVVVATPGRLLDLRRTGALQPGDLEVVAFDEVDDLMRSEDWPSLEDFLVAARRRVCVTATLPPHRAGDLAVALHRPEVRLVSPSCTPSPLVHEDRTCFTRTRGEAASDLLARHVGQQALVFVNRVDACVGAVQDLRAAGVTASAVHGRASERWRRRAVADFTGGAIRVLVTTDLLGRGFDLPELGLVINYDVPRSPTTFTHRLGRTARAGRPGYAYTLVTREQAAWWAGLQIHLDRQAA